MKKKLEEEIAIVPVEEAPPVEIVIETAIVEAPREIDDGLKTVEEWAQLEGHYNAPPLPRQSIDISLQKQWVFDATKHHKQWPKGLRISRDDYRGAVEAMLGIQLV